MKTIAKKTNDLKIKFNLFENFAISSLQQGKVKGGTDGDGIIVEDVVIQ